MATTTNPHFSCRMELSEDSGLLQDQETKMAALRAALKEGEESGEPVSFDVDPFIEAQKSLRNGDQKYQVREYEGRDFHEKNATAQSREPPDFSTA